MELFCVCVHVNNPLPYFAAALVSQRRPSCFLWRASPASQREPSRHHSHSSSSPTNAPFHLWPPPPASWTCSLRPDALSSCAGLHPVAWGAPSPAGGALSPALGHGRRPAPGTLCARVHRFCVRKKNNRYTIYAVHFNHYMISFSPGVTQVTNLRPRSSLLSRCWRFRWSPPPTALSSLFGLSGLFGFSLGFSESPSSHLSGFFRS